MSYFKTSYQFFYAIPHFKFTFIFYCSLKIIIMNKFKNSKIEELKLNIVHKEFNINSHNFTMLVAHKL